MPKVKNTDDEKNRLGREGLREKIISNPIVVNVTNVTIFLSSFFVANDNDQTDEIISAEAKHIF